MDRTCFIVGAGSFDGMPFRPQEGDLVIAADGGFQYLKSLGIMPDVLLGDFDSLERVPEHDHLIRHSPIKDDTDMALAVEYAREQDYHRFLLYGGLGGRLDHTMANIQLIHKLSVEGDTAYLLGEGTILTVLTGERIGFPETHQGMISVFSLTDKAIGVTEKGLKYSLEDACLSNTRALGVSNEFIGEPSEIEVKEGSLLLIWGIQEGFETLRKKSL